MMFPWKRRAEEERKRRLDAELRKKEVEEDWPRVNDAIEAARTRLDPFNLKAKNVFGGGK